MYDAGGFWYGRWMAQGTSCGAESPAEQEAVHTHLQRELPETREQPAAGIAVGRSWPGPLLHGDASGVGVLEALRIPAKRDTSSKESKEGNDRESLYASLGGHPWLHGAGHSLVGLRIPYEASSRGDGTSVLQVETCPGDRPWTEALGPNFGERTKALPTSRAERVCPVAEDPFGLLEARCPVQNSNTPVIAMRFLTALVLALALLPVASTARANLSQGHGGNGATIPTHGTGELTFTSTTVDPMTGHVHITGNTIIHGTFGVATGPDSYDIDPVTGSFVGSGQRTSPDGSTYSAYYVGQFINATDSIGQYTTGNGTGRFEGTTGAGTFASSRWANGLGSSSVITGTATF